MNGCRKFSFKTLDHCPKNHCQTRKPNNVMYMTQLSEWMFLRNTAGHHKRRITSPTEGLKIGYSTPIEKKRVPEFKILKKTDDKST